MILVAWLKGCPVLGNGFRCKRHKCQPPFHWMTIIQNSLWLDYMLLKSTIVTLRQDCLLLEEKSLYVDFLGPNRPSGGGQEVQIHHESPTVDSPLVIEENYPLIHFAETLLQVGL